MCCNGEIVSLINNLMVICGGGYYGIVKCFLEKVMLISLGGVFGSFGSKRIGYRESL